jgi:hypothetical protein
MVDTVRARNEFDITEKDIGRYVRKISTGDIGRVRKDPCSGWLRMEDVYGWRAIRGDLEYVTVTRDDSV